MLEIEIKITAHRSVYRP